MTPDERQALREKHSRRWENETPRGEYQCFECGRVKYPCDVIKALDWADEVLEELKGLTAHFEGIWY